MKNKSQKAKKVHPNQLEFNFAPVPEKEAKVIPMYLLPDPRVVKICLEQIPSF